MATAGDEAATCVGCGLAMMPGVACTVETLVVDGEDFARLPLGGETPDWWVGREPDDQCHDCAVQGGQIHHLSCDMEQCPNCFGQLLACGCSVAFGVRRRPLD